MQLQSKYSKFTLIFLAIICILQSAVISYFYIDMVNRNAVESNHYAENNAEPVKVCIIDKQSFTGCVYTYGQIKSKHSVAFKTPNFNSYAPKVCTINFKAGQAVKKDDVLLEFSCPEMIYRSQALFKEAEQKKILFDKLTSLKAASPTYETNKAGVEYDKAMLEAKAMQESIKNLTIKAPFDGIVSNCEVNLYERIIDPHKSLFSIYDQDNLTVEFYVDNNSLTYLYVGSRVIIVRMDGGEDLEQQVLGEAVITGINPCIDEQTGKTKIIADINHAMSSMGLENSLKHNMHVYVYFDKAPINNVFTLSKSAIIEDNNGYTYVRKVVKNGDIEESLMVRVEVIDHYHNIYAITSEQLKNGDYVIVEGASRRSGIPVHIKKIQN